MPSPSKRTFSLPAAQARYIDRKVKSGAYASASEVVRAGLRALQERDEAMERWLREEVMPVCEEIDADPSQTVSADELTAAVYANHARRTRKSA
jgi:antitoxin ParD1/3/4